MVRPGRPWVGEANSLLFKFGEQMGIGEMMTLRRYRCLYHLLLPRRTRVI